MKYRRICVKQSLMALMWTLSLPQALAFRPDTKAETIDLDSYTAGLVLTYNHNQYPVVSVIDQNSEALLAGLNPGDRVISINNQIAAFMGADQLRASLSFKTRSKINLEIERGQKGEQLSISFYPVKANQIADSALASELVSTKPYYPIKTQPLKSGFYTIDLPSFLRQQASESPLVLEFYQRSKGPSPILNERLKAINNNLRDEGEPLIALISVALQEQETLPLQKHFRITDAPAYIFVGSDNQSIKDYVDVMRHELTASEFDERLKEMIDLKEQALTMVPILLPTVAAHWREITNQELKRLENSPQSH